MNQTPSADDRRHVRTSLIVTLTVFFTLLMGSLDHLSALDRPFADQIAWAGGNETAAQGSYAISAVAAVPASTDASAADVTDIDPGCGSAEPCVVQAP